MGRSTGRAYGSVFAKKQMLLFMRHDKSIYDRGKIHNPCKHLVLLLCIALKKLLPENNTHNELFLEFVDSTGR